MPAFSYSSTLYRDGTYQSLVSDHRAFKIGDTITVLIYEAASATTSTDTETNKSASAGASITADTSRHSGSLGISNDFGGGGSSTQTGKLVASVSVTVNRVEESGDLIISGKQVIEFNNEEQHIEVDGRIRPDDITADNTIISTRIADARIKFKGEGLLTGRTKPGLITRFLNWLF
jgi:flagellar L-ring protein precursor FlgH